MSSAKNGPRSGWNDAAANTRPQNLSTSPDPLQALLARLPDAKKNGRGWTARCPAHEDRRASLSIGVGADGRALVKCFAGCAPEAVASALSLKLADLFAGGARVCSGARKRDGAPARLFSTAREAVETLSRSLGAVSSVWHYLSADGTPVGAVARWNRPGGGKEIRPVSRVSNGWIIGAMPEPRPLYRLRELREAETVYVVEGEKCADALAALGLVATTSAGGSQAAVKADWKPLAGKQVVIIPDNDDPGEKYAQDVAAQLQSAKILRLPGLPDGGDVVDFIAARRANGADDVEIRAKIERLAEDAESPAKPERPGPVLVRAADIRARPLEWLWPGRFPLGKLAILAGDPSLGKSVLTTDLVARVSRGVPWPDARDAVNPVGSVLIMSAEDDPEDTIAPRLKAAGANLERVHLLATVRRADGSLTAFSIQDIDALDKALNTLRDVRLVVVDPISAYLGGTDSHKNAEVRGLLAPLAQLAQSHRAAVLAVTHFTKAYGGKALYRAMGSLAFMAAARAGWVVIADPSDPRHRGLLPVKMNLGAELRGLGYRVTVTEVNGLGAQPVIAWDDGPLDAGADAWLAAECETKGNSGARDATAEWLCELLANGPVNAATVKATAHEAGIAWATVRRAKDEVGVLIRRSGFGPGGEWVWTLPARAIDAQTPIDAQQKTLSTYGESEHLCKEDPAWGEL